MALSTRLPRIQWGPLQRARRRFAPHVARYRAELLLAGACMLGSTVMALLAPWPLKLVIDHVLPGPSGAPRPLPAPLRDALPGSAVGLILAACAGVLVFAALEGALSFGRNLIVARVAQRVLARVRADVFAHVQRLPLSFHARRQTGDLLVRLTGDLQLLRDVLVTALVDFGARAGLVAGMIVVMAWLSPLLTLVALSVLPLFLLAVLRYSGRLKEVTQRQRAKEGAVATVISETLGSIAVVQGFARGDLEDERLARANRSSLRAGLRATRLEEAMARLVEVLAALGTCAVLGVGAWLALRGDLTAGTLVVFISYTRSLFKPLRGIARASARLAKASSSAERILDLLDLEQTVTDAADAAPAPPLRGGIELDGVTLVHEGAPRPALDDVSLSVAPRQTLLLVGKSGAGKTSLLSLLLRLADPTRGVVRFDGHDLRRLRVEGVRDQVGLVLQESVLFGTTVRENIAYGRPDATFEEIVDAARLARAHELIERLPDAYETVVGERGATLSGGERQRLALARAILKRAPILVLDEPTTGLDPEAEQALLDGLRAIRGTATTVVATHHPEAFLDADRVVVLEDGRVVEAGSPQELLARDGPFRRMTSRRASRVALGGDAR
jgi:ATP-binding cassette subfamily B protein